MRLRLKEMMEARREDSLYVTIDRNVVSTSSIGSTYRSAIFGMTTIGDLKAARRTFDIILSGTIPVIACDLCVLPFESLLNWDEFALFYSQSQFDDASFNIVDELKCAFYSHSFFLCPRGSFTCLSPAVIELFKEPHSIPSKLSN